MTDHAATESHPLPNAGHAAAAVADPHHSPEHIRQEMRTYWKVFAWLIVFTIVTVGVCFGLQLPMHYAVMVAMAVALVKGTLVACFFMHLISERRLIFSVLTVTVIFFLVLLSLPVLHYLDKLHY
jgi:cytochrome c oxidase subunit 4